MLNLINRPTSMDAVVAQMRADDVVPRLWAHDYRIWQDDPTEITNRLGWLHLPETMPKAVKDIERFAEETKQEGYEDVLLLGMGGSSLAPETFARSFGSRDGFPRLHVLDSTHPDAIRALIGSLDLSRTLVIVATKSGTTTETLSFFRYVYDRIALATGDEAVRQFVAITDPGSSLVSLAEKYGFRRVFENDPNLGGRYSALSHFGLVPAALIGIDIDGLLRRAQIISRACTKGEDLDLNPGAKLGAFLGSAAEEGRDKVTFLLPQSIAGFGDWVEQLIAESTGKQGLGILPVVGEAPGPLDVYGDDRVFVQVSVGGDVPNEDLIRAAEDAGHPVARIGIDDVTDLGALFFLWEMATALAGCVLGINPFDQPDVEAAKILSRKMVQHFEATGQLPPSGEKPAAVQALRTFLEPAVSGGYVAIQAYLPPAPATTRSLAGLQAAIRDTTRMATTAGYGPRFLHSTGQLHKGDGGMGRFVQFILAPQHDLDIPDSDPKAERTLSFGTLISAQAAGDRQALIDAGRRVLTLSLRAHDVASQLTNLAEQLGSLAEGPGHSFHVQK